MDLGRAVSMCEARGGYQPTPLDTSHTVRELSSSGTRTSEREPHPGLMISEALACVEFTFTLGAVVGDHRWWWMRRPALEQHHMTETNARQLQRVVQDRWAVSAAVAVEGSGG